jgi:hypothetical protein
MSNVAKEGGNMGPADLWEMLSNQLEKVARKRRGDPRLEEGLTYRVWHVLRVWLASLLEASSVHHFYRKLKDDKSLRARLKLSRGYVSESQLNKRIKTPVFRRALGEFLSHSARQALEALRDQPARILSMDLTRLESGPRDDRTEGGFDSRGYFVGYKLGLIITHEGVVLGMTLTKANQTELNVNRRLIHAAARTLQGKVDMDYLLCDSGFDGEPTFREAHRKLGARVICPPRRKRNPKAKRASAVLSEARRLRPHRTSDEALRDSDEGGELYRNRTRIERLNGQLKAAPWRVGEVPVRRRGITNLLALCLGKLVLYNCALNLNIAKGQPIAQVKHLVA